MCFEEADEKGFSLTPPPPPPHLLSPSGPNGATLGTVMTKFYYFPKYLSTHNITWNVVWLDLEMKMFESYRVLAPMGATYTIWTTLNPKPLKIIPVKSG